MKSLTRWGFGSSSGLYLFHAVTIALLALMMLGPVRAADKAHLGPGAGVPSNVLFVGWEIPDLSTPYSNSTTSYTAIGGTGGVITTADISKFGDYSKSFWWVCYSVQAAKATSTSGTVGVAVDGTVNADTARTVQFASGSTPIGGCFAIDLPDGATHTLKLMGKSGDTAAFTVSGETLTVWRVRLPG